MKFKICLTDLHTFHIHLRKYSILGKPRKNCCYTVYLSNYNEFSNAAWYLPGWEIADSHQERRGRAAEGMNLGEGMGLVDLTK